MTPTSAETALAYPIARKADQTDDYFGTKVSDPYRWMEDVDSPELKTWIDAENELTQNYLAQIPVRETMQRRLTELLNFERYTAPSRRGTRYFYSHNSGLQNQNVLYWQEGLTGEPHVLLDPNTFSADGTVAISGISITDDGALAAYSIADAGSNGISATSPRAKISPTSSSGPSSAEHHGSRTTPASSTPATTLPRPTPPRPKPSRPPTTSTRSTSTS
jgi:prolyl oligopeptidase